MYKHTLSCIVCVWGDRGSAAGHRVQCGCLLHTLTGPSLSSGTGSDLMWGFTFPSKKSWTNWLMAAGLWKGEGGEKGGEGRRGEGRGGEGDKRSRVRMKIAGEGGEDESTMSGRVMEAN